LLYKPFYIAEIYYSSPKKVRPILLVANIANPEAICA
jgi:hypothetical protein